MPCVEIDDKLYAKLQEYVRSSGAFSSVEELVRFVLSELVGETQSQQLSQQDEEIIKQRLRALGYI